MVGEIMLTSIKKNKYGIILMILSSLCVCIGQLLWKMSNTYGIIYLLGGFALYGIGAIIMVVAYRYGSLSVLQPVLSLNYVISIIIGSTILKESISPIKVVGVLTVILGVVLIAGGDEE